MLLRIIIRISLVLLLGICVYAQGRGRDSSPASQPPPRTVTPQSYTPEQVQAGKPLFSAQCGFCHGRDAAGGETGPDLTRSSLVAADIHGDKIGPVVRSGRTEKGMPMFNLPDSELAAIVAFIHDQKTKVESEAGGRRAVDVSDLQTGNAETGKQYFNAACARCHSPSSDFSGIASRLQGLPLVQRMLYPSASSATRAKATVTLRTGQIVTGKLAYRDEFTIALTDSSGAYRSWSTSQVKFTVDDPLQAHIEQLGKYTDEDIHNVLAYLQTLR